MGVVFAGILAALSLSIIISKNYNPNQGATSSLIQKPLASMSYNQVVQYALRKINEDRSKFNIPAVNLSDSNNTAAQLQAEDILKMRLISHYTPDGMKPYMEYTIFGGKGYVAQNIGYDGFNDLQTNIINKCKIDAYIFSPCVYHIFSPSACLKARVSIA